MAGWLAGWFGSEGTKNCLLVLLEPFVSCLDKPVYTIYIFKTTGEIVFLDSTQSKEVTHVSPWHAVERCHEIFDNFFLLHGSGPSLALTRGFSCY